MKKIIFCFVFIFCSLIFISCAPLQPTSSYYPQQMGRAATVMKGIILALRDVQIAGSPSGLGATAGAASGGVAGSYIGGDTRANVLGAIGGAVIGGIIGDSVERAAKEAGAIEFIVEQENGQIIAIVQTNEENLTIGENVLVLRSDKVRIIRDNTR